MKIGALKPNDSRDLRSAIHPETIEKLLVSVDKLIIGGAMAYPFLKAQGREVGISLCSDEDVTLATSILKADKGNKITLPCDHIVSTEFGGKPEETDKTNIEANKMGLDIGPNTIALYGSVLKTAKTVLWNGPMGVFEMPNFAVGTQAVAKALVEATEHGATTIIGGGDSASAIKQAGLSDKVSHVSTGGGASLEYLEGKILPGVSHLSDR